MDVVGLLKQKRYTVISVFLIFLMIGLLFLLTQNFKYGAKSNILIIQEGAGKVDPYSVSRSVEYLSDLLTRVVYSSAFFESVMNSNFDIDRSYFGNNSNDLMKIWKKTVSAKNLEDSGIIVINVYHPDSHQATQIALAVNNVLIAEHQNYHGLGNSVKISVIDQPLVSNYPVKPNLIFSFLVIIAISLFFSLTYIYLFPEKKYDISFFSEQKEKKTTHERIVKNIQASDSRLTGDLDQVGEIKKVKESTDYNEIKRSGDINNLFE